MSQMVLEGTWEEIVGRADELVGKKVRLTILEEDYTPGANGEISDVDEYDETVQAIREGIESFRRGEGRPAREALEELGRKYGISS